MTWLEFLPHLLGAAALLYLPGLAAVLPTRMPGLATLAVAPAVGIVAIAGSAVAAWLVGARWGIWWWLGATVVLAAPALLVRLWRGPTPRLPNRWRRAVPELIGIALALVILAPSLIGAMQGPDAFSQRYDNVFHLNAIRSVVETGAGSPVSFGLVGTTSFYPAAWYDWAALLTGLGGGHLTAAVQACTLVTVLAVWPIGMAWLAGSVLPPSTAGRLAAGPLALASVSVPVAFLEWGPLFPNLLGLAVAPGLIAAGWHALGRGTGHSLGLPGSLAALAAGGAATLLAHPNALIAAALFLLPAAASGVVRALIARRRGAGRSSASPWIRGSRAWTAAVALALVAFPGLWWVAATRFGDTVRDPFTTVPNVLVELAIGSSLGKPLSLALAIGVPLGLAVVAVTRRHVHLLAAFLVLALPYLAAATFSNHTLASLFAAPFYNDPYRTAAIVAIPSILLAVLGWDAVFRWALPRPGDVDTGTSGRVLLDVRVGGSVALAFALGIMVLYSPGWRDSLERVEGNYRLDDRSDMLTSSERALIERIGEHVPDGGTVAVNPWHGGGLVYALGERHVTQYFMPTIPNEDVALLNERLRDAASDPEVCAALDRLGVGYALELEDHVLWSVRTVPDNAGLEGLDSAPGFELIDSEGDSALYRITACG